MQQCISRRPTLYDSRPDLFTYFLPLPAFFPYFLPFCFCSSGSSNGLCSSSQPIVVHDNVKQGKWSTESKFTKPDGSKWTSSYKLSKSKKEWTWEAKSKGTFKLGKQKQKGKKKGKKAGRGKK